MNLLLFAIDLELLGTIAIIAIVIGIVLGLVEVFVPGFGIFGILGIIFCAAGVLLRIIAGQNMIVTGIIVVAIFLIFSAIFLILGKSATNGRLSRTPFVSHETALPMGKTEGTEDFEKFFGKEGVTITDLRPVGKATFDGVTIEIVSNNSTLIEKGTKVVVTFVEGQRVLVREL